jgi:hypothetical protein
MQLATHLCRAGCTEFSLQALNILLVVCKMKINAIEQFIYAFARPDYPPTLNLKENIAVNFAPKSR